MGPQIVRVEPDHLVEILYGPIVVTFELEIDRPAVPRLDVLRLEPDRLAEVLDGPIEVALPLVGGAPVDVGQRISGVEPERLVEVPDGSIVVALFEIDGPAIIEGLHVARPQADRFVEILDSPVVHALAEVGEAPIVESLRETRILPDGLIEILYGRVVLALADIGGAPRAIDVGETGAQPDRFVEVPNGAVVGAPGEIGAAPSEMTTGPPASRGADDGGEALHPLQALRQALAAEVEDDLAHPEPGKGGDVVLDFSRRTGERTPLARPPVERLGRIVDRRLIGNGEARGIATFRLGEPSKLGEQGRQLGRAKGHGGIRAHRMPAIAETRRPAQRGLAVTAHPDRRM